MKKLKKIKIYVETEISFYQKMPIEELHKLTNSRALTHSLNKAYVP